MSKTPNLLFSVDKWGWLLTKLENTVGEGIGPGHKYTVEQSEAQVQGLGVRVLGCKWTTAGDEPFPEYRWQGEGSVQGTRTFTVNPCSQLRREGKKQMPAVTETKGWVHKEKRGSTLIQYSGRRGRQIGVQSQLGLHSKFQATRATQQDTSSK